jgi:hypothetical protein
VIDGRVLLLLSRFRVSLFYLGVVFILVTLNLTELCGSGQLSSVVQLLTLSYTCVNTLS